MRPRVAVVYYCPHPWCSKSCGSVRVSQAFGPRASNETVFRGMEGIVTSILDGYNGCIFAYGPTGSGKTFTMEGTREDPGVNYRSLEAMFQRIEAQSDSTECTVSVSLLEIYNEQLLDMLVPRSAQEKLEIRRGPEGTYVRNLTVRQVASHDDVLKVMQEGYQARRTFATNVNEHSSRSHACVCST